MMENDKDGFEKRGRKVIKDKFTLDKMIKNIEKFLEDS
jgi:hypothetical protein